MTLVEFSKGSLISSPRSRQQAVVRLLPISTDRNTGNACRIRWNADQSPAKRNSEDDEQCGREKSYGNLADFAKATEAIPATSSGTYTGVGRLLRNDHATSLPLSSRPANVRRPKSPVGTFILSLLLKNISRCCWYFTLPVSSFNSWVPSWQRLHNGRGINLFTSCH